MVKVDYRLRQVDPPIQVCGEPYERDWYKCDEHVPIRKDDQYSIDVLVSDGCTYSLGYWEFYYMPKDSEPDDWYEEGWWGFDNDMFEEEELISWCYLPEIPEIIELPSIERPSIPPEIRTYYDRVLMGEPHEK